MKKQLKNNKFKHGVSSLGLIVLFIAVVIVINLFVNILMTKLPLEMDLTTNKIFNITKETKDYIENLENDVYIDVLATEQSYSVASEYYAQAGKVIRQYEQNSSKIKVKFIDIIENPQLAEKYTDLDVQYGDIVVSSNEKKQKVTAYDLFNVEQTESGEQVSSSKAEQALTSAILNVINKNPKKVLVLSGENTMDSSHLIDILSRNSYHVGEINFLTEGIPQETDIIFIPASTVDYTKDQIEKLDKYLDNNGEKGKNAIFISGETKKETPNLDKFLKEWGISIETGGIVETDKSLIYLSPFISIQDVFQKELLKYDSQTPIIIANAKSINILFDFAGDREVIPLLKTKPSAALRPVDAGENWKPKDADLKAFSTAVLSRIKSGDKYSNLAVISSVGFITEEFIKSSSFGNGEYFISIFDSISDKEEGIKIVPKELGGVSLMLSEQESLILTIIFLLIVPIFVIIMGIFVWMRRRNM